MEGGKKKKTAGAVGDILLLAWFVSTYPIKKVRFTANQFKVIQLITFIL